MSEQFKDSERVDTENGVVMAYFDTRINEVVHLAVPYEYIEHNLEIGVDLITPDNQDHQNNQN